MKKFKYKFVSCQINKGTEENPIIEDLLLEKIVDFTEANLEIAKVEAVGEISQPFDDGKPEVVSVAEDIDNMLVDHELRLTMIELYM